jgi:type II secretory pathway pseudopilin PulG
MGEANMIYAKALLRNQLSGSQRGMTLIGMLLLIIMLAFIALIAMKVVPLYVQYFTIKSTVESVRKEPQLAQMTAQDIQNAIQKRFDIGYVQTVSARDLKIRNEGGKRVLDLTYQDERPLFYGLSVVLKVNETVPLNP